MPRDLWNRARALIFDFDGVLADSEPFWHASYAQALAPFDVVVPADEYFDYWTSRGEGLVGHIRRHGLVRLEPHREAIEAAQQRAYRAFVDGGAIHLFPETGALLGRVTAPGARPFVVASNTPRPVVELLLRQGGAPVPKVVGGEGLRPKPAPDIFLGAARALGVAPADALVVEDTDKGIRAARAGGFPVLALRTHTNRALRLDADAEVPSLAALLHLAS